MTLNKKIDNIFNENINFPPLICVEMSGNHQGSLKNAISFVNKAKEAGADLLKVQVYRPETITINSTKKDFCIDSENPWSEHNTLFDLYAKSHTPWDWIKEMFLQAKQINLPIFASPFDSTAVEFLEDLECSIYKIASAEINDHGLIEACAKTGKPIILSTGLANKFDIDSALEIIKFYKSKFMILKCVSAYPTSLKDINVSTIKWLKENYHCAVGLSDHTMGMEAAFAATSLGANLIEKHFCMPGDSTSVDINFSMSLDELPRFKKSLRNIFNAIGTPTLELPKEAKKFYSYRRSLYVVKDIKKGDYISHENIKSIRPGFGMEPKELKNIIGCRVNKDVSKGEKVIWDFIEKNK